MFRIVASLRRLVATEEEDELTDEAELEMLELEEATELATLEEETDDTTELAALELTEDAELELTEEVELATLELEELTDEVELMLEDEEEAGCGLTVMDTGVDWSPNHSFPSCTIWTQKFWVPV
jgi:hypothetical protein